MSLATSHPELAAEWHPTLNGSLRPSDITSGASRKVWWLCPQGHSWDGTPGHRTSRGSRCPYCVGKRVLPGFNDLATTRPDLAEQWHPTKNDLDPTEVSAGSGRPVWWQDEHGHEWEARVNNRAHGTNCPICSGQTVLAGFNDLATLFPAIAAEWHASKNAGRTPSDVTAMTKTKAWFRCGEGHEWQSTVANRTAGGNGCPICAGQRVLPGLNDMGTTAPGLAAQWHPTRNGTLTPRDVFRSTAKKFWWQDSLGHEWEASANERSNGSNCPYCSGQRILVGFNDLGTARPDIAAQWHPTKNGDRTPQQATAMNGTKAWWLCEDGHEWTTTIASRSAGTGCPACAGLVVIPGRNDLASQAPGVAAQWHPSKNGALTPAAVAVRSNRKAWFRCTAGHDWESTVNNRTHGQGCPECAERGGFNPGRPGILYFLEHRGYQALKIGITNEGTTRLAAFQTRGWEVLNLERFERGAAAAAIEREIKLWWRRDLGLAPWLSPAEMAVTGGWSETVASAEVDVLECLERIRTAAAAVLMPNDDENDALHHTRK